MNLLGSWGNVASSCGLDQRGQAPQTIHARTSERSIHSLGGIRKRTSHRKAFPPPRTMNHIPWKRENGHQSAWGGVLEITGTETKKRTQKGTTQNWHWEPIPSNVWYEVLEN